jgi:mannose-1-phosphate guanylyltransferase
MNNSPVVLIMAGGVGSRFWPASRDNQPKQFLDITGSGKSLLQMTFDRFTAFIPVENIYVITHEDYVTLTLNAIPNVQQDNIIAEPSRNNTAASIALASFKLIRKYQDGVCIVAPADHIILNEKEFRTTILTACDHAKSQHSIVTLGINPTRPDTGYGYIEFESGDESAVRQVKSFREKPNVEDARRYQASGNFVWNSGIFIWRLDTILEAYKKHAPGINEILNKGEGIYNTDRELDFIQKEYPRTEKISVDYAILEKAENVYTIPCDIGWSDLGTWASLYDQLPKDESGNAILGKPVFAEKTKHTLILSQNSKLIVVKGLEDYIIVDTDDCLMIYPKSDEQAIKELKEKLRLSGLDQYL